MIYGICLLVVTLLFYGGQTQECNHCPNGFTHFPKENKCYKVIPDPVNWDVAFSKCNTLGAHLAVVKNAESNTALRAAITPFKGKCIAKYTAGSVSAFWTAGRRPCKNLPFKWSTGCGNLWEIGFTNWGKDEPNNIGGDEDCINLIHNADIYAWNDVRCRNPYCFICEIDM